MLFYESVYPFYDIESSHQQWDCNGFEFEQIKQKIQLTLS